MKNKRNAAGEVKPAAVLGDELRVDILAACDQREATPQEFVDTDRGLTLADVNYHFRVLARWELTLRSPGRNRAEGANAATTGPCDRASSVTTNSWK